MPIRSLPKKFKGKKKDIKSFGGLGPSGRPKKKSKTIKLEDIKVEEPAKVIRAEPVSDLPDPEDDKNTKAEMYSILSAGMGDPLEDENGLPNAVAMIEKAIAADLDPSVFTEQSFPVAPNVIEFCRNPEFLGFNGELFPKQVELLAHFFSDVCYFCSDVDYIHNVPPKDPIGDVLDRFVFLNFGVCPKCKRNRTEMLDDWHKDSRFLDRFSDFEEGITPRPVPPNEFVGVIGQRSGKSYTISTFGWPYILHRYLALPNPARYFNQPDNVVFEAAFVAPTLHQITKYVWTPFREVYAGSPWFREVKKSIREEERKLGLQLYNEGATFLTFVPKKLGVHILAANSGSLRGGTRIFCTLDELGWFNMTEDGKRRAGVKDGTEVFQALSNSLLTARLEADYRRETLNDYNALDGYMFNISSPSSINDPIMLRAAAAPRSPRLYYVNYKTWEFHPKATEEKAWEWAAGDKVKFMRDYCAIPPRALSPFFPEHKLVKELIDKEYTDALFGYDIEFDQDERGFKWLRPMLKNLAPDPLTPRVLTVDNGEKKNSFALCIGKYIPEIEGILFEEFIEIAPTSGASVDLAWCYNELILTLIKYYNILYVGFDRWEAAYAVHDIRTNPNINADAQRYSLKWRDFANFRDDILGMKVWFPIPEKEPDSLLETRSLVERAETPRAHFQLQLTTVSQFGKKLFKPDSGNDDLFRAAALAHYFVKKNIKEFQKHSIASSRRVPGKQSVGIFRGASGTRSHGGMGNGGGMYRSNRAMTSGRSVGSYRRHR